MKPKILVYTKMHERVMTRLREQCQVLEVYATDHDFADRLHTHIGEVQGLLGDGLQVDKRLLNKARQLRVISNISVGYDNLDLEQMTKAGVVGTHTPGVLTETTADLIFGLLMATARRIPQLDRMVKKGEWNGPIDSALFSWDIHHKTLGIIGMGRIGQAIARRARYGFKMPILYYQRTPNVRAEEELQATFSPLDELLSQADFVCLMTPLTEQTHHMIGAREFSLMKQSAIFINASRGKTVDEEALVKALQNKEITAAGLDVYESEPIDGNHPLLSMDHVVTLPHTGPDTHDTRYKLDQLAADNVLAVLQGKRPPYPLNPEAL